MFTPKTNTPPTGTGASTDPEAARIVMVARHLETLNTPISAVWVPVMIAFVSGIMAAFAVAALYLVYHYPNSIFSWMLLGMMVVLCWLWWIFVQDRRNSLWTLEQRLNVDLNNDGQIGKPLPIRRIMSEVKTTNGSHFEYWGDLPEVIVRESAKIIRANGYRVSQTLLTGKDKPLVKANNKLHGIGRSSYDVFVDVLTDPANGWGIKGNHGEVNLTQSGKEQIDLICQGEEDE